MLVVRAVHTFVAEHGDELEFQAGEDVEILEKDDAFGDGWWRGRNARGEEGLFPATYIAEPSDQAVPPDQTVHSPHKEVEIADPPAPGTGASGAIVDSHQDLSTSDSQQNGVPDANNNPSEEPRGLISAAGAVAVGVSNVMGKTIGEIQDAIESIAKPDSDDEGQVGIGHGARARLAAQAKLANEHRERQRSNDGVVGLVYSDDSEDEDEDARRSLRADANGLRNGTRGQPDTDPEQIPRNLVTSPAQSASSAAILQPALPLPVTPPTSKTESNNISQTPAYQWNVDQVASWAESKGFDDTICQKFREHEISGDLLLDLDANLLKELDIPQFGKRLRIAQAISELRRPPSISSHELQPHTHRGMSAPPTASITPPLSTPATNSSFEENGLHHGAWAHGRRTSSNTAPAPPSMTAIREGQTSTTGMVASSLPTSPVTPSSSVTKRESTGSMGHRKGKPSLDGKDRLSFFSRARKPAPHAGSPGERSSRLVPTNRVHQMQPASPEGRRTSGTSPGTAMALRQIGIPDHSGYMKKKGERYGTWKTRYFVLKGHHLYYLKSEQEDRVKGHIDVQGCRVIVDEHTNPGSYGFRLVGHDKPHAFSSPEQSLIREWMKALMKATIARDYTVPVTSSCNIPTIPLAEAQALSPRPPSPATREATQRASRRENTNQLTAHDASVLMSLDTTRRASQNLNAPTRPDRDNRRPSSERPITAPYGEALNTHQQELIKWVNDSLPLPYPKATMLPDSFISGEVVFLLVRALSGIDPNPPVPPGAFTPEGGLPGLPGLFAMMDLLIDAGIDTVGTSINDVRLGDTAAICRLLDGIQRWAAERSGVAQ